MPRARNKGPTGLARYILWKYQGPWRQTAYDYMAPDYGSAAWVPVARLTKVRAVLRRILRAGVWFRIGFASPVALDMEAEQRWSEIDGPSKTLYLVDRNIRVPYRLRRRIVPYAGSVIGRVRPRGAWSLRWASRHRTEDRRDAAGIVRWRWANLGVRHERWRPQQSTARRFAGLVAAFARACVRQGAPVCVQIGILSPHARYVVRAGMPLGERVEVGCCVSLPHRPVRAVMRGRGRLRANVALTVYAR